MIASRDHCQTTAVKIWERGGRWVLHIMITQQAACTNLPNISPLLPPELVAAGWCYCVTLPPLLSLIWHFLQHEEGQIKWLWEFCRARQHCRWSEMVSLVYLLRTARWISSRRTPWRWCWACRGSGRSRGSCRCWPSPPSRWWACCPWPACSAGGWRWWRGGWGWRPGSWSGQAPGQTSLTSCFSPGRPETRTCTTVTLVAAVIVRLRGP